jgi:hypothetical protein
MSDTQPVCPICIESFEPRPVADALARDGAVVGKAGAQVELICDGCYRKLITPWGSGGRSEDEPVQ